MTHDSDILIVGGGLVGMTTALALRMGGMKVALIDAQRAEAQMSDDFDGRGYALALSSQRLLDALDLWPALEAHAQPMLDIKVADGRVGQAPSPFFMHFDHAEIEEGPMGFMVEDRYLRRACLDRLSSDDGITYLDGTRVVSQDVTGRGITLGLSDGRRMTAPLLIGADGRASGTARRAGIRRTEWGYDQTALVCAVAHEAPHLGVAHQLFLPGGPLAILPLTGNRSSIVWSERRHLAKDLLRADDAVFLQALRPRFGDFLGRIELAGQRFGYPLGLSLAQSFVSDRLCLVGDAAHGVHPIAGQGLNAGLRDVAALVETLISATRRGEDFSAADVLARYARWRHFDTAAMAMATDAFYRMFSNDNALVRMARDVGMGAVNAVPGLRRGFIREAAGLTGDVPRLMQGLPI